MMSELRAGGVDESLRDEVFVSGIGEAPPSSAGELRTYFLEVHRCCVRWLAGGDSGTATAMAFVLSERLDLDPVYEGHLAEFNSLGRLDGETPGLAPGSIMLTSRNLRLGFGRRCGGARVRDIAEELRGLGLSTRPTAIFVPSERTLLCYRAGVDEGTSFVANATTFSGLDGSDVAGLVRRFHEEWTRFPDGLGACWDNAGLRIVERYAERNIRNSLFVFLSMVVYKSSYVAREHQLPNGRADIFIYGILLGEEGAHRILELKVLRSRSAGWVASAGKKRSYSEPANRRYVERGLRQAVRYKESSQATESFLFCFDARLEDVEIDVQSYADSLGVVYRRYFMESSVTEDT